MDVDTRRGLEEGVPRLLELFRRRGVRASFFVTMGPETWGRAVTRLWRPDFLAKLWRTRAWRLYGLRALLAGTVLPPRLVGAAAPGLLRQAAAEGHEVAPHGWDHAGWQQCIHRWRPERIGDELRRAADAVASALGTLPAATAAPGWRTTPAALLVQDDLGFRYAGDARGPGPFRPVVGGTPLKTLQVPTTLPTMDEVVGRVGDPPGFLLDRLGAGPGVFTLHAEVEGGPLLDAFVAFLDGAGRRRARLTTVGEVADAALQRADEILPGRVERGRVAGRSGWVATGVPFRQ